MDPVGPIVQEAGGFSAFANSSWSHCRLSSQIQLVTLKCACKTALRLSRLGPTPEKTGIMTLPWWFLWHKKVTVFRENLGCGPERRAVWCMRGLRHGMHVANTSLSSFLWMLRAVMLQCLCKEDCCVWEHVHVHVVTAEGARFVLSVCAYCFFSLSLQSKTTSFTYSAHCNSSVRFIPVRLKEASGMSFIVNQICGNKLLDNCCNNQCIVACMDIYRQVTNFTDILSVHSALFMMS